MPVNNVSTNREKIRSQNNTPAFQKLQSIYISPKLRKKSQKAVQLIDSLMQSKEFIDLCTRKDVKIVVKLLRGYDDFFVDATELNVKILYKNLLTDDKFAKRILHALKLYQTYRCRGFSGYNLPEAERDLLKQLPTTKKDISNIV